MQVVFLGYVVSKKSIKIDASNVKAIKNWLVPSSVV